MCENLRRIHPLKTILSFDPKKFQNMKMYFCCFQGIRHPRITKCTLERIRAFCWIRDTWVVQRRWRETGYNARKRTKTKQWKTQKKCVPSGFRTRDINQRTKPGRKERKNGTDAKLRSVRSPAHCTIRRSFWHRLHMHVLTTKPETRSVSFIFTAQKQEKNKKITVHFVESPLIRLKISCFSIFRHHIRNLRQFSPLSMLNISFLKSRSGNRSVVPISGHVWTSPLSVAASQRVLSQKS